MYLEVELPSDVCVCVYVCVVYVVPVYTVCVYVRVHALYLLTLLPGKVRVPVALNPCLHWLVSHFPILAIPVGNWCNMFSSTLYFPRDQGEFLNLGDPGACLCADGKAMVEMESFKNCTLSSPFPSDCFCYYLTDCRIRRTSCSLQSTGFTVEAIQVHILALLPSAMTFDKLFHFSEPWFSHPKMG